MDGPTVYDASLLQLLPQDQDFSLVKRDPLCCRLLHQNVRSIYSAERQNSLDNILFNAVRLDIDVIGLTETWLDGKSAYNLSRKDGIRGVFRVRSCTEKNDSVVRRAIQGKGALLLIKEDLAKYMQCVKRIPGRAVMVELGFKTKSLVIICVYAPTDPRGSGAAETEELRPKINGWIRSAQKSNKSIVLMGDLNGCFEPVKDRKGGLANAAESPLMQDFKIGGLHDLWRERHPFLEKYTHRKRTAGGISEARLDYILSSTDIAENCTGAALGVDDLDVGSDHFPVLVEFHTIDIIQKSKVRRGQPRDLFDFKKATSEQWADFLLETRNIPAQVKDSLEELENNFTAASLDSAWLGFAQHLKESGRRHLPWHTSYGKKQSCSKISKTQLALKVIGGILRAKKIGQGHEKSIFLKVERLKVLLPDLASGFNMATSSEDLGRLKATLLREVKQLHSKENGEKKDFYLKKRMEDFSKDTSRLIASIMDRKRLDGSIQYVRKTDGTFACDGDEVKETVKKYFSDWFQQRQAMDPLEDPDWNRYYQPLDNVDPVIYDSLMAPPSFQEIETAISSMPNNKSSGPGELPSELLKKMDRSLILMLVQICRHCCKNGVFPSSWHRTTIFAIPKGKNFSGDLNALRPITLIDTGRKLFSTILTGRLSCILEDHHVLKGYNFGASKGVQALDAVHLLQTCIEDANLKDKNIEVLSLDIRRAFDSVPFSSMERSLRRLRIPDSYVKMVMRLLEDRQVSIITDHGLTAPLKPLAGIEQGEVNAPLFWKIFYDPLLTRLAEEKRGYMLEARQPSKLDFSTYHEIPEFLPGIRIVEDHETPLELVINNICFVDDLTLIGASFLDISGLSDLAESFLRLHDIQVNPSKTVHARKTTEVKRPLVISGTPVGTTLASGELFRILGVMVSTHCCHHLAIEEIRLLSEEAARTVRSKALTDKIITMIYKSVVLPKLVYKSFGLCISEAQAGAIEKCWRSILKNKSGLPRSSSNALLHCEVGFNIPRLADGLDMRDMSDFQVWLNGTNIVAQGTRMHWNSIASLFKYPTFPPMCPKSEAPRLVAKFKYLHFLHRLSMKNLSIFTYHSAFSANDFLHSTDWYIAEILPEKLWKLARNRLHSNKILFLSQLRGDDGISARPWTQFSSKSNDPTWWKEIKAAICKEGSDLLQDRFRGVATTIKRSSNPVVPRIKWMKPSLPVTVREDGLESIWWTDGSLNSERTRGGSAAYSSTNQLLGSVESSAGLLSSTSAELGGILLALKATPASASVSIFSDSKAAIALCCKTSGSLRSRLKNPNKELLDQVEYIKSLRSASIKFQWIRGHSGISGNEEADRLANEARLDPQSEELIPEALITPSNQFRFAGSGRRLSSLYARALVKAQANAGCLNVFLQSSHGSSLLSLTPDNLKITVTALKSCMAYEPHLFTSQANSTFRAFRYKLVMGLLPTMSRQVIWKSDIYLSSTCPRCQSAQEDQNHVFSCPCQEDGRKATPKAFTDALVDVLPQFKEEARSLANYLLSSGLSLVGFNGTISPSLLEAVTNYPSEIPFHQRATAVLKSLFTVAWHEFWKPRCEGVIAYEKATGITTGMKRSPNTSITSTPKPQSSVHSMKLGRSREVDASIWKEALVKLVARGP